MPEYIWGGMRMSEDVWGCPRMSKVVWGCLRISNLIQCDLMIFKEYEISKDSRDRRGRKDSNDGWDCDDNTEDFGRIFGVSEDF